MTEVTLHNAFSSLEQLAKNLNDSSDEVNRALADAEAKLVSLNIGLEIWHSEELDRRGATGSYRPNEVNEHVSDVLGFARVGGKWCLAVKSVTMATGFFEGDPDCPYTNEYLDRAPEPLMRQSRNLRIKALTVLPDFLKHMASDVRETSRKVEIAISRLSA